MGTGGWAVTPTRHNGKAALLLTTNFLRGTQRFLDTALVMREPRGDFRRQLISSSTGMPKRARSALILDEHREKLWAIA